MRARPGPRAKGHRKVPFDPATGRTSSLVRSRATMAAGVMQPRQSFRKFTTWPSHAGKSDGSVEPCSHGCSTSTCNGMPIFSRIRFQRVMPARALCRSAARKILRSDERGSGLSDRRINPFQENLKPHTRVDHIPIKSENRWPTGCSGQTSFECYFTPEMTPFGRNYIFPMGSSSTTISSMGSSISISISTSVTCPKADKPSNRITSATTASIVSSPDGIRTDYVSRRYPGCC